jgi:hypothetical protein
MIFYVIFVRDRPRVLELKKSDEFLFFFFFLNKSDEFHKNPKGIPSGTN